MPKLFHGTTLSSWEKIKIEGFKSGTLVDDVEMASWWKARSTPKDPHVVLQADIPKLELSKLKVAMRASPVQCCQYTLKENCRLDPEYFCLCTELDD